VTLSSHCQLNENGENGGLHDFCFTSNNNEKLVDVFGFGVIDNNTVII